MSELSPAARSVFESFNSKFDWVEDGVPGPQFNAIAAALRAAVDQVLPKEWPTIEDYNEYEQGVAAAHIKYRNQILAIADEFESLPS